MPAQPNSPISWLNITDFTPGLVTVGGPQQPGAASSIVNCYPLPQGGLTPFFDSTPITIPFALTPIPDAGTTPHVSSFLPIPTTNSGEQLIIGVHWISSNADYYQLFSYTDNTLTSLYGPISHAGANGSYFLSDTVYMRFYSGSLNVATDYAGTTTPFVPTILTNWRPPSDITSTTSLLLVYPSPNAPSTVGAVQITPPVNAGTTYYMAGSIVPYSSRVIIFNTNEAVFSTLGSLLTNDSVFFSDPPGNANIYNGVSSVAGGVIVYTTNPFEVFGYDPSGYGAFSTLSPNSIMLISKHRGGILVQGDIANPTSVQLPAIESTHGTVGIGADTHLGFVYVAGNANPYVYMGSIMSSPMGSNIALGSFLTDDTITNVEWQISSLGQFIFFSNNYVFDTVTSTYFSLSSPYFWSRLSASGKFYTCPLTFTNTLTINEYTLTTRSPSYSWTSHPIFSSQDSLTEILEAAVQFDNPATITLTITGPNSSTTATGIACNAGITRIPIAPMTDAYFQISISVTSSTPLPATLFSIGIRRTTGTLAQSQSGIPAP